MKKVVNVQQHHNPKFDSSKPEGKEENPPFIYLVETLKNLTLPAVGVWIKGEYLESMIDNGIEVNVRGPKREL